MTLFYLSFHNLDLIQNYALLYSDLNQEHNCDKSTFWDIREMHDCNGVGQCQDYAKIYIKSIIMKFASYIIVLMLAVSCLVQSRGDNFGKD